jgi:membrane-associated phospholipid phosphatase
MRARPVGLILWLLLLAAVEAAAFAVLWRFAVRTVHGQSLDFLALSGNSIGQSRIEGVVSRILDTISAVSLLAATAAVGFIALARRRVAVALGAVLLIVGTSASAYLLKAAIVRPDLGVDPERAAAGNSLPSGHAAVAGAVAAALLLVVPPRARGVTALGGAVFAAAAGTATLSAGWHRPSDAITALLLVGFWACVAGLFVVLAQRAHGGVEYGARNRAALRLLLVAGLVLLAGAAVAVVLVEPALATPVDELGRRRLFAGYAGGAMAISATACLVLGSVLASAHRVAPQVVRGAPVPESVPA